MFFSDEVPEGFGHELDWLADLEMPVFGLPAPWLGWRLLGDAIYERGETRGEPPTVAR